MFPDAFVDRGDQGYWPPIVSPLKPEVKGSTKTNDKNIPMISQRLTLFISRSRDCV